MPATTQAAPASMNKEQKGDWEKLLRFVAAKQKADREKQKAAQAAAAAAEAQAQRDAWHPHPSVRYGSGPD